MAKEEKGGGAYVPLKMFLAGGIAGASARTASAPLDRIKLLFQVQAMASSGMTSTAYTGVYQSLRKIYTEEGVLAFWKGNFTNVVRVFPYSACQLMANDLYKRLLSGEGGTLSVSTRLIAGAFAGMTATAVTHPLDTVRLRLAMPKHPYTGLGNAMVTVVCKEGYAALYKGLGPTLVGIAPYAALNFATYDLVKEQFYGNGRSKAESPITNLVLGGITGCFAATCCYPLDTIRRRMQMKGSTYKSQVDAFRTIWRSEGYRGFYRGWAANILKVIPQNSIRFVAYEVGKSALGLKKGKTDT
mmetsp:Transcript_13361/g.37495  ORF Transcript_13361/g.37495 Transcript_13361/m.37495 type:complete len:300 (-) Transcript_13361:892-1791(-)